MTLLLDLDDTLIASTLAYAAAMHAIGIAPNDPNFLQARAEVKRDCPTGYPAARSRSLYFKRYLERTNTFTPKRLLELVDTYQLTVVSFVTEKWKEQERPRLLAQLRERYKRIGIVSNETVQMQARKLQSLDPDWTHFDFAVISEELGCEKPDARLFFRALELAGQASAKECVFVGDNYELDIHGSTAVGMRAVQSIEFVQEPRRHTHVVSKLDELLTLQIF